MTRPSMLQHGGAAGAAALALFAALAMGCSGESSDGASGAAGGESAPTLPTGLAEGWNEFAPGGESVCSRGTDYKYWVRKGTVNKVVIDFMGGGACWNAKTCGVADAIFEANVDGIAKQIAAGESHGIYDVANAENPFRDWYHVIVPYCTGDVHWGDSVVDYGDGVTIEHKGAVNASTVLDWVYAGFSAPENILVTGCSAGSYGAALWSAHVAKHYPSSRIAQLGDSGAGIITKDFFEQSFPKWNAQAALPSWIPGLDPMKVDILGLSMVDLYMEMTSYYADATFSQYNTAFDETQAFYFKVMGGTTPEEWSQQMLASIDSIEAKAPRFASFVPSGEQHCILGFDNFYTVNVGGKRFVDWVNGLVEGAELDDLRCTDCTAPTP